MEGEKIRSGFEKTAVPEYSFEAGIAKILDRIEDILRGQPQAVVAFCASGADVGKTQLAMALVTELFRRGIPGKIFHDPKEMEKEDIQERIVFIFDQMEWDSSEQSLHKAIKENHNADVSSVFEKLGREVKGIDLWVGIYRPDRPFHSETQSGKEYSPIADILIRNEEAKNKLREKKHR
jgi:hypothetical protein